MLFVLFLVNPLHIYVFYLNIFWMVMLMVHPVYVICPCGILKLGTQIICNILKLGTQIICDAQEL